MAIALAVLYLWAGATVCFALWHLEEIAEALHGLHPNEFSHKNNLRGEPMVMAVVTVGWPIVLPAWAWLLWKERANA